MRKENKDSVMGWEKVIWANILEVRCAVLSSFICVGLLATPWTVAHQAPLSMEFSRQEYWSGLPFLPPGDLPNPGIKPGSPALQADSLLTEPLLDMMPIKKKKKKKNGTKKFFPQPFRGQASDIIPHHTVLVASKTEEKMCMF